MTRLMSQAEFARELGVGRAYVSALKQAGRLVLDEETGKVDADASRESIARSNGAPERSIVVTPTFEDARDRKEHYAAELARLDYEERCGSLVPAAAVVAAVADAGVTLRTQLESLADLLAPQLVGVADEQQIRARIAEQVEHALVEVCSALRTMVRADPA